MQILYGNLDFICTIVMHMKQERTNTSFLKCILIYCLRFLYKTFPEIGSLVILKLALFLSDSMHLPKQLAPAYLCIYLSKLPSNKAANLECSRHSFSVQAIVTILVGTKKHFIWTVPHKGQLQTIEHVVPSTLFFLNLL